MTVDAGTLARLVDAALPEEALVQSDLETCCYGPDSEVHGDAGAAAVVTIRRSAEAAAAWLVLLAVHPEQQRCGHGRRLVELVADRARAAGAAHLHLGNAIPRYVWPGVDFAFTAALSLFEATGFEPYGAAFNMAIPTAFRAEPPSGVELEREAGAGAAELAQRRYPYWVDEVTRGTERGTCFAARRDGETVGFACHSVNRRGWIGPMGTHPERQRGGVGNALLAQLCTDLARDELTNAEIAWVGPVGFYAKAGARVSRVFRNAKLSTSRSLSTR